MPIPVAVLRPSGGTRWRGSWLAGCSIWCSLSFGIGFRRGWLKLFRRHSLFDSPRRLYRRTIFTLASWLFPRGDAIEILILLFEEIRDVEENEDFDRVTPRE